jgi:two-component system chemotaxis response regulator CheB
MLDKFQIFLASEELALQDSLNDSDLLMVLSSTDGKEVYFLKSDVSTEGFEACGKLLKFVQPGSMLRTISKDVDAKKFTEFLSERSVTTARISTYRRKCVWKYNFKGNSLRSMNDEKIRVLVVDDSKTIRSLLENLIAQDPDLEVVGSVADPTQVEAEIRRLKPDVMTLDIHMPKRTGVEVIKEVMKVVPVPTIMISSLGINEGKDVLMALEAGAIDYIQKPSLDELAIVAPMILEKLKVASAVDLRKQLRLPVNSVKSNVSDLKLDLRKVICIGSSTGGTEAIRRIFGSMPKIFPAVVIAQHIPKLFSLAFAESLRREFKIEVFEAKDGQEVMANQVLIAPGGLQMELAFDDRKILRVRVFDGEPINRHKPSVDVLLNSAARLIGKRAVGVILTGMGSDGAKGLLAMRKAGAATFAQDEASSVVYGMPRVAKELGGVDKVVPLNEMALAISQQCRQKTSAA